jgi:hypothetical protein
MRSRPPTKAVGNAQFDGNHKVMSAEHFEKAGEYSLAAENTTSLDISKYQKTLEKSRI